MADRLGVLVPLALGMAIRAWMPSLGERAAKPVGLIGVTLVLLCSLPLLIRLWRLITSFFGDGTLLMLALITVVGTGVGHFPGGPDSWDGTVLGLSTSARHPAVAIAVETSAVAEGRLALAAVVLTCLSSPSPTWSKNQLVPAR